MRRNQRPNHTRSTSVEDGFINVAVNGETRRGLNNLKAAMGVRSQGEVIEKLVAIGVAIHRATH